MSASLRHSRIVQHRCNRFGTVGAAGGRYVFITLCWRIVPIGFLIVDPDFIDDDIAPE
jgi:hypothetical protein